MRYMAVEIRLAPTMLGMRETLFWKFSLELKPYFRSA